MGLIDRSHRNEVDVWQAQRHFKLVSIYKAVEDIVNLACFFFFLFPVIKATGETKAIRKKFVGNFAQVSS